MNKYYALVSEENTLVLDRRTMAVQILEDARQADVIKRSTDLISEVTVVDCGDAMTPLKTLQSNYPSQLAFARAYDIHPYQLRRWLDNDAHVDGEGNVYIRTKGKLVKSD